MRRARGGVKELRRLAMVTWVVPRFQALVRGYLTRKHLRAKRELEVMTESCIFVQRMWRGSRARIIYDDLNVQRQLMIFRQNCRKDRGL